MIDTYRVWSSKEYIELRDVSDCRLTLFNAKRGEQPARITIANWIDAKNDVSVDPSRIKSMDEVDS